VSAADASPAAHVSAPGATSPAPADTSRSALGLPALGFGAAALGNLFTELSDETARATVDAAWDAGIRAFDVAPHYGLGLAERRLGSALADRPRDEMLVSTKVGRLLRPSPETAHLQDDGFAVPADVRRVWDASEHGIRASLDESLQRMGLDRVDLLFLHDPEDYDQAGSLATGLPALAKLRDEGLVRGIGVGTKSLDTLRAAVRTGLIDVVMLAGRYTLLEQPALAELLPECLEAGVEVVAVGVYNSGALSSASPSRDLPYEYGAMPDEVHTRILRLAQVCRDHGVELPTAALHYPLRHPAVTSVMIGARTPEQIDENVRRFSAEVPEALWTDLAEQGLAP
jgi:D-threo-aldose 1-dehydrogenase